MFNIKEFSVGAFFATAGTIVSAWLGGWDVSLQALVAFMVVDYITGVLAAVKQRKLNSEVMFWGGVRKGRHFCCGRACIGSRCLLGQPVTKTSTNTMKITYDFILEP